MSEAVDPAVQNVPQEAVAAPEVTAQTTSPAEPSPQEPVAKDVGGWTPVSEPIMMEGVKYGDFEVSVEIPADLANLAGEKGLDIQALSKELYSSPDFTLSQETLEGLYSTFGKWQVDAYLSGVKAKNDALVGSYRGEMEARAAEVEKAWEATMEIMGGKDRWDDMAAFASDTLSESEVEEFNHVMENGSLRMQQLMIKDLYEKFSKAGAPVAPAILDLEEGSTGGGVPGGLSALSSVDYLKLIATGEYKKDPAKYDALRRMGMAKGI